MKHTVRQLENLVATPSAKARWIQTYCIIEGSAAPGREVTTFKFGQIAGLSIAIILEP